MKNKWRRLLISIAVLTLLNVIPAYASEVFYWNGMEIQDTSEESVILPEEVTQSTGQARGEVISTGILNIKNEGKGKVALTIETLAHIQCDKICNSITLQKWSESAEDWEQVDRYEFEALQENQPDEELRYLINGVDVENLEPGKYRARGLHAVYFREGYESFASKTNGVQVTKY